MIAGFDEVGRGAWAGPLVVAGVVLPSGADHEFRDSKYYTPAKRMFALKEVYQAAIAITISVIPPQQIDQLGLGVALKSAFVGAADQINIPVVEYIVDGAVDYLGYQNSRCEPKADDNYQSVAAASIVAKVHRDQFMARAAKIYERFGFERHVGYGTAEHKRQLQSYGPTSLHRRSFKPVKLHL